MFYDWSECVMSVLGTTKHSSCISVLTLGNKDILYCIFCCSASKTIPPDWHLSYWSRCWKTLTFPPRRLDLLNYSRTALTRCTERVWISSFPSFPRFHINHLFVGCFKKKPFFLSKYYTLLFSCPIDEAIILNLCFGRFTIVTFS